MLPPAVPRRILGAVAAPSAPSTACARRGRARARARARPRLRARREGALFRRSRVQIFDKRYTPATHSVARAARACPQPGGVAALARTSRKNARALTHTAYIQLSLARIIARSKPAEYSATSDCYGMHRGSVHCIPAEFPSRQVQCSVMWQEASRKYGSITRHRCSRPRAPIHTFPVRENYFPGMNPARYISPRQRSYMCC